jgi:hypothetical protein
VLGITYQLHLQPLPWQQAQRACQRQGAHLASVASEAARAELHRQVGQRRGQARPGQARGQARPGHGTGAQGQPAGGLQEPPRSTRRTLALALAWARG